MQDVYGILVVLVWVTAIYLYFLLFHGLYQKANNYGYVKTPLIPLLIGFLVWMLVIHFISHAIFNYMYPIKFYGDELPWVYKAMGVSSKKLWTIAGLVAVGFTAALVFLQNYGNSSSYIRSQGLLNPSPRDKLKIALIGLLSSTIGLITAIINNFPNLID